jgi:hypothetical protein
MLAAALVTLSGAQVVAICVITVAAIVLSYVLGTDEGFLRGVARGRALERAERQDAAERAARERISGVRENWRPARGEGVDHVG